MEGQSPGELEVAWMCLHQLFFGVSFCLRFRVSGERALLGRSDPCAHSSARGFQGRAEREEHLPHRCQDAAQCRGGESGFNTGGLGSECQLWPPTGSVSLGK